MGTDFGAPNQAPAPDAMPVDEADLARYQALLVALWESFDVTVQEAKGKELSTAPRRWA